MRSESEKKSVVKSVKMSPLQVKQIMEQAEQKNMNFSEFMIDSALHSHHGITPQIAVKMQEMVNLITAISDELDEKEYIRKETLRQKVGEFDELIIPLTPQEKYNNLEKQIGQVIDGGAELWESLK